MRLRLAHDTKCLFCGKHLVAGTRVELHEQLPFCSTECRDAWTALGMEG